MRAHGHAAAEKAVRSTCFNGPDTAWLAPDSGVHAQPHGLIIVWTKVSFFECSDLQACIVHGRAALIERRGISPMGHAISASASPADVGMRRR